eukprot:3778397-Amphidinium_carterae.1
MLCVMPAAVAQWPPRRHSMCGPNPFRSLYQPMSTLASVLAPWQFDWGWSGHGHGRNRRRGASCSGSCAHRGSMVEDLL